MNPAAKGPEGPNAGGIIAPVQQVPAPWSVSVVIPCRNAACTVGAAVATALAQSNPPVEVLVVDDGSDDGSAEVARAAGARVLRLDQRGNAGGARNHGLQAATGNVVAFLDADVEISKDWLQLATRAFDSDPAIGAVGGRILDGRDGQWASLDHYLNFSEWIAVQPRFCAAYPTIAVVYRRDAIGNTRFPASNLGEDIFFALGVQDQGWRCWYEPRISIVHRHQRLDWDSFWNRQVHSGRALYTTRRLLDRPGKILLRVPVLLGLYPHLWIMIGRMLRSGLVLDALRLFPWLLAGETARIVGFFSARREFARAGNAALGAAR